MIDRQGEWVEVADAVVVRQAALRAHPQAVGSRLPLGNRTQRAAAAQVTRDQASFRIFEQLRVRSAT